MDILDIPIGTRVLVLYYSLIAEPGYWSWDINRMEGEILAHPNDFETIIKTGESRIYVRHDKVEYITII